LHNIDKFLSNLSLIPHLTAWGNLYIQYKVVLLLPTLNSKN